MSSALAEALLAAQRQAVASLSKAYVAGNLEAPQLLMELDRIGLRDAVDQGSLLTSLDVLKAYGGEAPKPTGQNGPKMPEPDVIVSKEQASEIIEALKAGTYNADAYSVPF